MDRNEVHRVWHYLQEIQLQPPNLAYSYEMFGLSAATLETVVGQKVIAKIFGTGASIAAQDAIPDQVINLLKIQLQKLSDRLEEEQKQGQYVSAQEEAGMAAAKYLPRLQSEKSQRGSQPY